MCVCLTLRLCHLIVVICLDGNHMEAKPLSECLAIVRPSRSHLCFLPRAHSSLCQRACVLQNQQIVQCIKDGNFDDAMRLRGHNYLASYHVMNTLMRSYARSLLPAPSDDTTKVRVAVLHAGACAPGMNAAVRAVVRLGLDRGFSMVGVCGGIAGLQKWDAFELSWMDVNGWAKLGTKPSLVMRRGIVVSTDKPREMCVLCARPLLPTAKVERPSVSIDSTPRRWMSRPSLPLSLHSALGYVARQDAPPFDDDR